MVATAFLPAPAKANDTLLSPAAIRSDIVILCDACASLHPGLYRYLTLASFQRARQRLDRFAATPHTPTNATSGMACFRMSCLDLDPIEMARCRSARIEMWEIS